MPTDALVDDLLELAQIAAPTFAEEARIRWIEKRLAGLPGRRRREAVGNLVWEWGEGRPRVLLAAHVDTVFDEATSLYVEHDGPWLVGPGIGDNAAAVAVAIHVVEELLGGGNVGSGAVAFTVGEEGLGNLRGAREACEALRPEAVIALEGHGLEHVIVDAVGSVRARVRVTGSGGHSWVDRGHPSAIHALLDVASALVALSSPERPVNIGLISGGRSVNAIADEAELVVEQRGLDESALDGFADRLDSLVVPPPLDISVDALGRRPAGRLDRALPLLRVVRDVRAALGLPDVLGEGSTDANAALALGIPALTLGVANGSGMHTLAERIHAGSLDLGRAQVLAALRQLLGAMGA